MQSNWSFTENENDYLRPTKCASGDHTMEWRSQPQRQRVVNKIMGTLKRNLPLSGYETLQELKNIAQRVEEEIYTLATSQSEYSRKTCFMILTMETRLQTPLSDPIHSKSADDNVNPSDWQDEVYQKITAMMELYLLDWRDQLESDIRPRIVNRMLNSLKMHLPFSGDEGLQELKKKTERFEKEIYTAATTLSDYLWKISLKVAILIESNGVDAKVICHRGSI